MRKANEEVQQQQQLQQSQQQHQPEAATGNSSPRNCLPRDDEDDNGNVDAAKMTRQGCSLQVQRTHGPTAASNGNWDEQPMRLRGHATISLARLESLPPSLGPVNASVAAPSAAPPPPPPPPPPLPLPLLLVLPLPARWRDKLCR
ncbi:hypothetical protein AWZ03_005058 [Drosophila navojoa]|uniref:Uncharacterized protein n=1 Tax=Drosophila navojoa TaxID=7232 RepID=A0A484BIJ9_DRONA|nr:hypothetical protein AWZ03_005058 [Drosophila navojoa]